MPTYYEILGLPDTLQYVPNIPKQTLRGAYRRALLQNHPDKYSLTQSKQAYSIDLISEAFSILSKSESKAKYDNELKTRNIHHGVVGAAQAVRTGLETVDLDDLDTEDQDGVWYRSCRCGNERGFVVREEDLEAAAEDGEISLGCQGCSLWLKVLFGVLEEEQDNTYVQTSSERDQIYLRSTV